MRRAIAILLVVGAVGCSTHADVSRAVGARCASADECDDRCLPPGAQFPDGFCSLSCETNDDCPFDARCVNVEAGVCLLECVDDAACAFLGEAWRCRELAVRQNETQKAKVCIGGVD